MSLLLLLALYPPVCEARTIEFSGRTWEVRTGYGGPGPNHWSDADDAVWVDDEGALHLTLARPDAVWRSTEVYTTDCTQYGVHRFYVDGALDTLDPNVVLGLFTYQDDETEIDIEASRWGNATEDWLWQTVQPGGSGSQRSSDGALTGTYTTHTFTWRAGYASFESLLGFRTRAPTPAYLLGRYRYAGAQLPTAEDHMRVHINLWAFQGLAPRDHQAVEVVLPSVELPAGVPCD